MKNKKYILIILAGCLLFLEILYFILNDNRKLTIVESVVKEPVLFVQKIILKPIKLIGNSIDDIKEFENLNSKVKEQEEQLKSYTLLQNELKVKDEKIKELQDLLNINTNLTNYSIVSASVINRNVGNWYQTFTIDKGKNDNIEKNQAVISSKGLIGKVIKTTTNFSVVKLLTGVSKNFQVAVIIDNDGEKVFGILSDYQDDQFIITGLAYNKEIKIGSTVTTSGLDNIFPSGLLIGTVATTKKDNYDLEQLVYINSSSNFDDINYVSILRREE